MDFMNRITVFTYGTLMKGFSNEGVISMFPHENYPAIVRNVEMFDVGNFPALIKGDHSYEGELIVFDPEVKAAQLYAKMDYLEGYRKSDPKNSLYIRDKITVSLAGDLIDTEVYFWNRSCDDLVYIDPNKFTGYRDYFRKGGIARW